MPSYYYKPFIKNIITCGNCGGTGHVYKQCNHPISSYGVIAVRFVKDPLSSNDKPYYLMVQRKDSLSYVEFLRGKYGLDSRKYLLKLFSNMTESERDKLLHYDFDPLWKELWQVNECNNFMKEYNESKFRFQMLKKGYNIKTDEGKQLLNIDNLVKNTQCNMKDTEWGFPKGRRNINEQDIVCALREFQEETGINKRSVMVPVDIKGFEEVFTGTNNVRYRHVYYLAFYKDSYPIDLPIALKKLQCKEVKTVKWLEYEQAQEHIPLINIERKELFKRVNEVVLRNMSHIYKNLMEDATKTKDTTTE